MYTLLIADDSVTIQRVIELTFADEDVRVVAVSDGGEAIAMLDTTPPDIVLADVGMPGQNGYEVARHIKDTPRLAHIPIVLLTGAFEPIDQAKVAEVGCDGVLAKPFEPQLVIARVKELLARPRPVRVAKDGRDARNARVAKAAMPEAIEPWVRPSEEGPPADRASQAAAVADIDNYFDRLDAALSKQHGTAHLPEAHSTESQAAPAPPSWFDAKPDVAAPPPGGFDRDVAPGADERSGLPVSSYRANTAAADVHHADTPSAPPTQVFPSLADAFAALLAAEQSGPAPATRPTWPVMTIPAVPEAASSPAVPDDIVEQVTHRVLDQLSDRLVRETVAEVVLATAERLVKEEIERIKRQME